jgi:hypothetical protein
MPEEQPRAGTTFDDAMSAGSADCEIRDPPNSPASTSKPRGRYERCEGSPLSEAGPKSFVGAGQPADHSSPEIAGACADFAFGMSD